MNNEDGAIKFMGGKYDGQRIDSVPLEYLRSFVANGRRMKKYKNPAIRRRAVHWVPGIRRAGNHDAIPIWTRPQLRHDRVG